MLILKHASPSAKPVINQAWEKSLLVVAGEASPAVIFFCFIWLNCYYRQPGLLFRLYRGVPILGRSALEYRLRPLLCTYTNLILILEPRDLLNSNEASVLPLHYTQSWKFEKHYAYVNMEKSGLEPENTIRKIVVLPIRLYPLCLKKTSLRVKKRSPGAARRTFFKQVVYNHPYLASLDRLINSLSLGSITVHFRFYILNLS